MKVHVCINGVFAALGIAFMTSGCGSDSKGSDNAATVKFRNVEIAVVSGSDLEVSSDSVAGTGSFKLVSPLAAESQGGAHVGVTFELLADDAEVTLVAFASANLENGVNVVWTKTATTVSADAQSKDITSKLSAVDWAGAVSLRVDIHNNEDPTHMIMWSQALAEDVDEEHEIYNSAETEDGDFQVPGRGDGTFGGFVLKNASVTDIVVLGPQEEDH